MGKGMRAGRKPKGAAPTKGRKAQQMQKMQQIQAVQQQMEEMQKELDEKEVTASAGGGVVQATVNGKKELVALSIDQDVVDPDDVETLQDLIIAAVNEGIRQIEEMSQSEYGKLTDGLGIDL